MNHSYSRLSLPQTASEGTYKDTHTHSRSQLGVRTKNMHTTKNAQNVEKCEGTVLKRTS